MTTQDAVLKTDVPGLDAALAGGLPQRFSVVVTGKPGSGKTILCSQVCFALARRGIPVVIATVTSEPHDKLLAALRGFAFYDEGVVGEELFVVSAYASLKQGAKAARDILIQTVRDRGAKLLFVDGMRSLRDLWRDEAALREFFYELSVGLGAVDCVLIMSTEYDIDTLMTLPEATTVDGVVALSVRQAGARRLRRAEIIKLRGRPHLTGEHAMVIDGSGVRLIPRLESVLVPDFTFAPTQQRAPFGLPALDTLLGGGLPINSATTIAGSTGIGKTLLALHFAAPHEPAMGPALVYSFRETQASLVERAKRVNLDLTQAIQDGHLLVEYQPYPEIEADEVAYHLMRKVAAAGARRVVLDGMDGLVSSVMDPQRVGTFFNALVVALRAAHCTSVFVKEVPKITGMDLDFSDTPTAVTAENLIFLRHTELAGRVHRILSILKMRDSTYDDHVREFVIQDRGFSVMEPFTNASHVLTGNALPLHLQTMVRP